MNTITQWHDKLKKVLQSKRFLKMEGLGNELPFFIAPHPPQWEWKVQCSIEGIKKDLATNNIKVMHIHLYTLCMDLLKNRGVWDKLIKRERKETKEDFLEIVQSLLSPERHVIPAIQDQIDTTPHDILFLSGVGQVYPYLRSHSIISNLQNKACKQPTVLFFPGTYTTGTSGNTSLDLFNIHAGDNYYRAFNIFHFEV